MKNAGTKWLIFIIAALMLVACRPPEVEGTVINMQKNLLDEAYASAEEAVEKYPGNAEAQFYWGYLNGEHKKDYAVMNDAFDKALALNPAQNVNFGGGTAKLGEAVNQYRTNLFADNYNSAVKLVNSAMEADDKDMMQKAIDKLMIAKNADPSRSEPYQPLAIAKLFTGDSSGAEMVLGEGLKQYPDDENLLLAAGDIYLRSGKMDEATAAYKKAIELNPGNAAVYQQLGQMEAGNQNWESAQSYFAKAIELDPDNPDLSYNIGVTYYNQQQYVKAIPFFKKNMEINGDDINTAKIMAVCYVQTEDLHSEGITYLESVVETYPDDATLWEYLALLYGKSEMADKAEAAFKRSQELK